MGQQQTQISGEISNEINEISNDEEESSSSALRAPTTIKSSRVVEQVNYRVSKDCLVEKYNSSSNEWHSTTTTSLPNDALVVDSELLQVLPRDIIIHILHYIPVFMKPRVVTTLNEVSLSHYLVRFPDGYITSTCFCIEIDDGFEELWNMTNCSLLLHLASHVTVSVTGNITQMETFHSLLRQIRRKTSHVEHLNMVSAMELSELSQILNHQYFKRVLCHVHLILNNRVQPHDLAILKDYCNLSSVTIDHRTSCPIEKYIEELNLLSSITKLSILFGSFSQEGFQQFISTSKVKEICLYYITVKDCTLLPFNGLKQNNSVQSITLKGQPWDKDLFECKSLRKLELNITGFDNICVWPDLCDYVEHLKIVSLSNLNVSQLVNFRKLKTLYLQVSSISTAGITFIVDQLQLQQLILWDTSYRFQMESVFTACEEKGTTLYTTNDYT
jgi:hypothetical protein